MTENNSLKYDPEAIEELQALAGQNKPELSTFSSVANGKLIDAHHKLKGNLWMSLKRFGEPCHTNTDAIPVARSFQIAGFSKGETIEEMVKAYAANPSYTAAQSRADVTKAVNKVFNTIGTAKGKAFDLNTAYEHVLARDGAEERFKDFIADESEFRRDTACDLPALDFLEALDDGRGCLWCVAGDFVSREDGGGGYYRNLTTDKVGKLREKFKNTDDLSFLVTNAMTARTGKTQEGNTSQRCNDNAVRIGEEEALNIEMDGTSFEGQLIFLQKLYEMGVPVIWGVSSGNKSLHIRVCVVGLTAEQIAKFKLWCVMHGADPAALRVAQLVRLPNGYRTVGDKKVKQECLFYDPGMIGVDFDEGGAYQALGIEATCQPLIDTLKKSANNDIYAIDVFYNKKDRSYYHENGKGEYFPESPTEFTKSMMKRGIGKEESSELMHQAKMNRGFEAVVEVAGWHVGLHSYHGKNLLVTKGYVKPKPLRGEWPLTKLILERLFGQEQLKHLYGQLKQFAESLQSGIPVQVPALVVCGVANSGKTLFGEVVVKNLFNARMADPQDNLLGKSSFNLSVIASELLIMDDVKGTFSIKAKAVMEGSIKQQVATSTKEIHPKGFEKVAVRPTQLLMFMLNTNDDDLAILPDPTKDGSGDKFSLYKVNKVCMPMPTTSPQEKKAFEEALAGESAAFLHFLLHEWEIPEELKDSRWGAKTYHHPELYDHLAELSDNAGFEELIEEALWGLGSKDEYEGSVETIMKILIDLTKHRQGLHMMLRSVTGGFNPLSLGSKLGRAKFAWASKCRIGSKRGWRLIRPEKYQIEEGLD